MGKTQHSPAGKKHKAKYKRSKVKKKKEDKKEYAYFRLKGLENKKSEEIKKLMKEFKSKRSK